ncbi:hypothetical protein HY636_05105 [Candidatus Woesearchaeota archaeon]|nr:hypothetical protein [Candidatus Woesearchaeota archaeon]
MNKLTLFFVIFFSLILSTSFANAIIFKQNMQISAFGHKVKLIGVTSDEACLFNIDDKLMPILEHEEGKYNGIYIWVNDAIKTHSEGKDYCDVILSFPQGLIEDKNNPTNSSSYKNTNIIKIETAKKTIPPKDNFTPEPQNTPPQLLINEIIKPQEKTWYQKIIGWFVSLFE